MKAAVFVDRAHVPDAVSLVVFAAGLFGGEGEAAEVALEGGRWFEHGDLFRFLLLENSILLLLRDGPGWNGAMSSILRESYAEVHRNSRRRKNLASPFSVVRWARNLGTSTF